MKTNRFIHKTLLGLLLLVGVSCSQEADSPAVVDDGPIKFTLSMSPFDGEPVTRTTVDGLGFEGGDQIRFKIICPNSKTHELGERWSSYYTISVPTNLDSNTSFFMPKGPNDDGSFGSYESQATTYIYTAQNTTGTRIFVVGDYRYSNLSNFFFADQSKLEHFKRSDVVWAQAVRQTGAREVHFNFKHKVAKLDITVEDYEAFLSEKSILTLEGMPNIDGAEIVVGDYYADESYEDYSYNYRTKASCKYENNGKVIGIEFIDEAHSKSAVNAMTGNPYPAGGSHNNGEYDKVPNTGTYRAYHDSSDTKHFMLYVPPCILEQKSVIWLRDGSKRYSVALDQLEFKEGYCYNLKIKIGENPAVI